MFLGVFLGCVIGQILLALFNIQTPRESFVGAFWQSSAVIACWLTMRAADWRVRRRFDGTVLTGQANNPPTANANRWLDLLQRKEI